MKNARLCREADADVLGYWSGGCLDLAAGAAGRTLQGGQGSCGGCCSAGGDGKASGQLSSAQNPFPSHPLSLQGG